MAREFIWKATNPWTDEKITVRTPFRDTPPEKQGLYRWHDLLEEVGIDDFSAWWEHWQNPKKTNTPEMRVQWLRLEPFIAQELGRCASGHDGMTADYYFHYNWGYIEHGQDAESLPEYSQAMNHVTHVIEAAYRHKFNLVIGKRRRIGLTWLMVHSALRRALFNAGARIAYTSDTEKKSYEFNQRLKATAYDRLPEFMKSGIIRDSKETTRFGRKKKDKSGRLREYGLLSEVNCIAPSNKAHEGGGYYAVILDEAGIQESLDLEDWLARTQPAMADSSGISQGGPIFVFGVAGKMKLGGAGEAFERVWKKSEEYFGATFFLERWWRAGHYDENGNDLKAPAEKIIKRTEKKLEKDYSKLLEYKRQYPETVADMFSKALRETMWSPDHVQRMEDAIDNGPLADSITRGVFRRDEDGRVRFDPSPDGMIYMLEPPPADKQPNAYVAGTDPVDSDYDSKILLDSYRDKRSDNARSKMVSFVMKRSAKDGAPLQKAPVCMYADKPKLVSAGYRQIFMMCEYYHCQNNIETNRGGAMIAWAHDNGYTPYLATGMVFVAMAQGARHGQRYGTHTGSGFREFAINLSQQWMDEHAHEMYYMPLFEDYVLYDGKRNSDYFMAFSKALELDYELDRRYGNVKPEKPREYAITKRSYKTTTFDSKKGWIT